MFQGLNVLSGEVGAGRVHGVEARHLHDLEPEAFDFRSFDFGWIWSAAVGLVVGSISGQGGLGAPCTPRSVRKYRKCSDLSMISASGLWLNGGHLPFPFQIC